MRNCLKFLFVCGLLLSKIGYSQQLDINSLRYFTTSEQTRIQFEVTASPKHRVFVQSNPSRLIIDINNARLNFSLPQPVPAHPLFASATVLKKNLTDLRIVLALKKPIDAKNFSLSSNNKNTHQLLIALINKTPKADEKPAIAGKKTIIDELAAVINGLTKEKPVEPKKPQIVKSVNFSGEKKPVIVAIDAGHGGEDPGARGASGIEEKNVVFAIAKKLAKLINENPGTRAVMVRRGDYYLDLRKRMHIARKANADLFISIHADAFPDGSVSGASVYTLSESGASSEAARWLAKNENAADLIGGVSLNDKEEVLASVLMDLSQSATQQASLSLAKNVLRNFQQVGSVHKRSVQKAGFLVLKSPDIPSILIETAYISNPLEEVKLQSHEQQIKIAKAIFNGVRSYVKQITPAVDVRIASL